MDNPNMIDSEVSVALATYNGSAYIARQIESIFRQTCLPSEIIICDDRSSDTTVEIIEELSQKSPIPIRLTRNDYNIGHAENFFKAVKMTKTRYIAFCDQDDIWHPDKIKVSVAAIRRDRSIMVVHNAILIDENDRHIGQMEQCQTNKCVPPQSLDPWTIYPGLTQLVDRQIFSLLPFDPDNRGYDSNNSKIITGHDSWTSFAALTFGPITTLSADLVYYRQHGRNVYGFNKRSLFKKIKLKITEEQSRIDRLAWLTEISRFRHSVISKRNIDTDKYVSAERFWERVHGQCKARYDLAKANGFLKKVFLFLVCVRKGVYKQPYRGGLGFKRMFEDILMGLLGVSFKPKQ